MCVVSVILNGMCGQRHHCERCGAQYKLKKSLTFHQRHECGVEPQFPCPHCAYRAKRKTALLTHVFCRHGSTQDSSSPKAKVYCGVNQRHEWGGSHVVTLSTLYLQSQTKDRPLNSRVLSSWPPLRTILQILLRYPLVAILGNLIATFTLRWPDFYFTTCIIMW